MNSITKEYKRYISHLDYVDEKLEYLKGKYSGKKAVILAPGPSLAKADLTKLYDRDDIVILAIKQAYDAIKGQCDFHIVNTYNFDKYNGYNYENLDCIIFYGLSQSYVNEQWQKLLIKPHPFDLWVPVMNPPKITYEQCIHKSADFDKLLMLSNEPQTWWGTSIMYEQALPMAFLLGCKEIVTIGWDLGTGAHYYDYEKIGFTPNKAENTYTEDSIKTTKELYNWIKNHNFNLSIISESNPADPRFNRIDVCQI